MSLLGRILRRKNPVDQAPIDHPPPSSDSTRPGDSYAGREALSATLEQIAALGARGRYAEAHAIASAALAATPNDPDLLFARATALLDMGRNAEARAIYEGLEKRGLVTPVSAAQLAKACHRLGDDAAAEAALLRAIRAYPTGFDHRYAYGSLLYAWDRFEEAVPHLEAAVAASPAHADAHLALGNVQINLQRSEAAEAHYLRAAELGARSPAGWTNVGFARVRQDRYHQAIEAFRRAYALEREFQGDVDAYVELAVALADEGHVDEAIEVFEANLGRRPSPRGHWSYALALLRSGRFHEGWSQHEFRWLIEPALSSRPQYGIPVWNGQPLEGKTILVRAEQGIGDTIQMMRYVPALARLGARVLLRAPPGFEALGLGVEGLAEVLEQGTTNPPFDYYIPTMSLPGAFRTTLESVPAVVPYIDVDAARRERWSSRLGAATRPRVGLVWAGSPDHLKDRYRSITLDAMRPILSIPAVQFVSLQKGVPRDQIAGIDASANIVDLGPELVDLADTAAVIEQLDLVIGVDTAVVHLAGALGRPVWNLVASPCDWRWLEGRDDSPWYPTMRIYRQQPRNDWASATERVGADLSAWVAGPRAAETKRVSREIPSPPTAYVKRLPATPAICSVAETRWGILQYPHDPGDLADSLEWYGEWLEAQICLLGKLLPEGAIVLESGAGIGAHTLALSTLVGDAGRVYACEADVRRRRILRNNVDANGRKNIVVMSYDPGDSAVTPTESVDAMGIERLDLLKVAAPGSAARILAGGAETLWRTRCAVFFSVASDAECSEVVGSMKEFSYRCWRSQTTLFDADNFNRRTEDIHSGRAALAVLGIPEEVHVDLLFPNLVEVV